MCAPVSRKLSLENTLRSRNVWYIAVGCCLDMLLASFLPDSYYATKTTLWRFQLPFAMLFGAACPAVFCRELDHKNAFTKMMVRFAVAIACGNLAFGFGMQYVHLCHSGVKWLEVTMAMVLPAAIGILIGFTGLRRTTIAFAVLFIVFSAVFSRPYLNWAHGEPTRWESTLDRVFYPSAYVHFKYDLRNGQHVNEVASLLGSSPHNMPQVASQVIERRKLQADGYIESDELLQWQVIEGASEFESLTVTLQFRNERLINHQSFGNK